MLIALIVAVIYLGMLTWALTCVLLALVHVRLRQPKGPDVVTATDAAPEGWLLSLKAAYDAGYYKTEADCARQSPLPWGAIPCEDSPFWSRLPLLGVHTRRADASSFAIGGSHQIEGAPTTALQDGPGSDGHERIL